MIKEYIKPEIKISLFDSIIKSDDGTPLLTLSDLQQSNEMNTFVNGATQKNSVQNSRDFNKAIQFNQ